MPLILTAACSISVSYTHLDVYKRQALSNTPLQVDCTFLMLSTHVSKNTSASHLNKFYVTFDEIKKKKYDGMIITGAPVENLEYEEVNYWPELSMMMEWSKTHVTSTIHICLSLIHI